MQIIKEMFKGYGLALYTAVLIFGMQILRNIYK